MLNAFMFWHQAKLSHCGYAASLQQPRDRLSLYKSNFPTRILLRSNRCFCVSIFYYIRYRPVQIASLNNLAKSLKRFRAEIAPVNDGRVKSWILGQPGVNTLSRVKLQGFCLQNSNLPYFVVCALPARVALNEYLVESPSVPKGVYLCA